MEENVYFEREFHGRKLSFFLRLFVTYGPGARPSFDAQECDKQDECA